MGGSNLTCSGFGSEITPGLRIRFLFYANEFMMPLKIIIIFFKGSIYEFAGSFQIALRSFELREGHVKPFLSIIIMNQLLTIVALLKKKVYF